MRRFVNGFSAKHIVQRMASDETAIDRRKKLRISARELGEVQVLLRRGEKVLARGEAEEAEKLLIQALTIDPHAHAVQEQLGKLYLTTNRPAKAEALYRELLSASEEAELYGNLGLACYKQGKFGEACDAYQKALTKDPKNAERMAALAKAYVASNSFEEAIPLLEKATLKRNRDIELLQLLTECYRKVGNTEKAAEAHEKLSRVDPYNTKKQEKLMVLAATSG